MGPVSFDHQTLANVCIVAHSKLSMRLLHHVADHLALTARCGQPLSHSLHAAICVWHGQHHWAQQLFQPARAGAMRLLFLCCEHRVRFRYTIVGGQVARCRLRLPEGQCFAALLAKSDHGLAVDRGWVMHEDATARVDDLLRVPFLSKRDGPLAHWLWGRHLLAAVLSRPFGLRSDSGE